MNTQHDITVSGKPLNPPKPPAKPHMLLWIDTETTGLDPNQCELLEVGMQVTDLKMECIELTADTSFCLGNAIKYLWRYHSKGRPVEDLEKARWYLCRVIDYGEKIAWTRQQYDILTALVAHTVGVEARTWAKLKQGYPDSALALIDELIKRERDKQ